MSNFCLVPGFQSKICYILSVKVAYSFMGRILILKYEKDMKVLNDVLKLYNNLSIFLKIRLSVLSKMKNVICSTEMNLFLLKVSL